LPVIARGFVAEPETAPVTPTVTLEVVVLGNAGAVGATEITPVGGYRIRPAGSAPAETTQVYAPEPPKGLAKGCCKSCGGHR
jgi:hypothetical protein